MYNYTPDKIIASLAENNYFANRRIAYAMLSGIHDTPYSISEVNPYALYDYLLSTGWEKTEKQKKNSEVVVLKAPADSLTISVPIDMTLPDYETTMGKP